MHGLIFEMPRTKSRSCRTCMFRKYMLAANRSNLTVKGTMICRVCIFLMNNVFFETLCIHIYSYNSSPRVHSHGNPRVAFVQAGGGGGGGGGFRDIPLTMKILYYKSSPFFLTTTNTALLSHPAIDYGGSGEPFDYCVLLRTKSIRVCTYIAFTTRCLLYLFFYFFLIHKNTC